MSWATFDDAAPLHRKQVAAGAKACWLWTCGLAYCERQEAKDGFIPDAVIKTLYPGLGPKEAGRLVGVVLWEKVDGGYHIHDFEYWRARRFGQVQSERGTKGGSVSSDAKRLAALEREHRKRLAQQPRAGLCSVEHNEEHNETTIRTPQQTTSHPDPIRSDPIRSPTTSDLEEPDRDPGRETVCPLDLYDKAETIGLHGELAEKLAVPIESIRAETRDFVSYWTIGGGSGRRRSGWMRQLRERIRRRHGEGQLKARGLIEHEARRPAASSTEPSGPRVPYFDFERDADKGRMSPAALGGEIAKLLGGTGSR